MAERGEKVGVLKVRLYRPFSLKHFLAAIPESVRSVAVLDRTKEPGSAGEPLYQDIVTAFAEARDERDMPRIIGGRYGLSSKEFTPWNGPFRFQRIDQIESEESLYGRHQG